MRKQGAKEVFAAELEAMLEEMPLSKVRVAELCRRVEASTPTFYYHFRDKYELASWIFLRDIAATFADGEPAFDETVLVESLRVIESRLTFYRRVFSDDSQNSIARYSHRFNVKSAVEAVKRAEGIGELDPYRLALIEHQSYGMIGLLREWVMGDLGLTREQLARLQYERTPDFLARAYGAYPFSSEELFRRDEYEA